LPSPRPVFGASASSAFYRRQVILDLGGFPESFGAYFEDVDLSFRLRWAGWQIVHEPASRVWHRVSASHGKTGWRLLAQQSRNEERVFWRNMPRDLLGRAVPLHLGVLLAKAWRRLKAGELLPFLWGRLSVLMEVPSLRRHRRITHQLGHAQTVCEAIEPQYWG
jgi:GT2 family glycosyltransferase